MIQSVLPQLNFSFYRHQPIPADFSGGQITSDAGLLPLRASDQRHHLTRDWAAGLSDPRQHDRLRHDSLALLRQRIYQIVAGYEDANDADRLRHDPMLQIVADQKLGDALGSQPTLSRWETRLPPAIWCAATTGCASSSSASAATRSASVGRFCSTSIPPTIPLMASNNSASSTAVMASTCITPC
ncbi:MAG: hypothetical protein DMG84_22790 [Acidobacteria bacterium]|nr:MAG: hypothetical protein DMG84_22790 [Acidobacteriota bacterium]